MPSKLFDLLASDGEGHSRSKANGKDKDKTFSARDKNKKKAIPERFDRDEIRTQPNHKAGIQGQTTNKQSMSLTSNIFDGETENRGEGKVASSSVKGKKIKKTGADRFTLDEIGTRKKMTPKQKTQAKKAAATAQKKAMKATAAESKNQTEEEENVATKGDQDLSK
ncbi:hypothetical protein ONS95_012626 [Cadophora gregata]|uniref:uncharacterized protein n=1 Tax=Cadophora gregata TaxID=51156 RepID=UPI0026DBC5CA|nr:uncharacterized protein ONS95_012626 [Cadophora gregata]KAK0118336.1 hypothetical protein ONS95_012626 [Cadophora gregata]KAK0123406.1 hypothetical protein ONS96_010392 [Cadophora gregata f. sp. sojae]